MIFWKESKHSWNYFNTRQTESPGSFGQFQNILETSGPFSRNEEGLKCKIKMLSVEMRNLNLVLQRRVRAGSCGEEASKSTLNWAINSDLLWLVDVINVLFNPSLRHIWREKVRSDLMLCTCSIQMKLVGVRLDPR